MNMARVLYAILITAFTVALGSTNYAQETDSSQTGRIVFDRADSIMMINADGTGERQLSIGSTPEFSNSGDQIAHERGFEIYVMDVATLAEQRVTFRTDIFAMGPSWAPNDDAIVFWEPGTSDAEGNRISES